jgi:hypothetical protein
MVQRVNRRMRVMNYYFDCPHITISDWQTFRKKFPPNVIREVIDRSEIKLPEWFVPLARGVAIASDTLLRKAGYRRPSERPSGWSQTECDVFIKRTVADKEKIFSTLTVRQYDNQKWWTVERYHEGRKYENITDVLVFDFGSTPIFCRDYQSAMWLAEYCQLNGPPPGLNWVAACPDDKDGAIEFAQKRRIDEACYETHS